MNFNKLRIIQKNETHYVLTDFLGEERGVLDIVFASDEVEISRFWVHPKYRGKKERYGKQLLDAMINYVKVNTKYRNIKVIPKPEELSYGKKMQCAEEMSIDELYRKYTNLGFQFKDKNQPPYRKVMYLYIS